MGNEARDLSIGSLEVRHVPEPDETYDPSAHDDPNHVTGFVDIGAKVNGVFVPFLRKKASGLFADIERAAGSQPQQPQPPEPSSPPPAA